MDNPQNGSNAVAQIEVVEACGEWFVRVMNDGQETTSQFDLESLALAYAEGQRLRLKLEAIRRL
ncbi:hypothetical protein [Mesorhizobium sp. B2-3-4]|uniref:hypothetical protein n=1 Tax=Mesorhizobium sp. B2-3-4 TaxID=2589959 RepID=UPI00112EAA5A|nr:hypothetical protein [Mesorhizobium sp. B2-3-4]TPM34659.1 hypothetical protein FJ967_21750 [Mesorhizobium sp. B2-3-4]